MAFELKTRVLRLSIPRGRRIIAVSDIHGHLSRFKRLLEMVRFCDEDELFIIGDYIAKGPENLAALRFVMELDKRENVHVLMGNMEYLHGMWMFDRERSAEVLYHSTVKKFEQYGSGFYGEMLAEHDIIPDASTDFEAAAELLRREFSAELDYLLSTPAIIETDNIIFVHGGIPTEDVMSLRDNDALQYLKNDDFVNQGRSFSRCVIVGHWPVCNYHERVCCTPFISEAQRIISIDGGTGVKRDGQLNALVITDEAPLRHETVFCDDFPMRRALDAQPESEDFICFEYGRRHITILEQDGEKTLIEHHASGKRLRIPTESIWYEKDVPCAMFNNYEPEVCAGDLVSLLRETESGYFIKKNGVCGCYRGRLEPLSNTEILEIT